MDIAKRTATVSARVPAEVEKALQSLALLADVSLSEYICGVLLDRVADEQRRYLHLKAAFDHLPDLPCKSGNNPGIGP